MVWMAETTTARVGELKDPPYEVFIAALTVLSILNIVLQYAIDDPELDAVLFVMNGVLTVIFFIDFSYRLLTARSKSGYFFRRFGWADLLASVPIPQAKIFRLFRLVRVVHLLRGYGVRHLGRTIRSDRAESALLTLLLAGLLVLEFGSLQILRLEEHEPNATIVSGSDALWYVVVTISTVGYGDLAPVTNAGRVVGALIIVLGVGIFGAFTGYLANLFLAPRRRRAAAVAGPTSTNEQIRQLIVRQRAITDELDRLSRSADPDGAGP